MKMLDLGILLQAPSIWIELFSIRGKPKWIPSLAGEKPHPDQLQSWSLCFIYPTAVAELLQSRHLRQVGVQCNLMQLFLKLTSGSVGRDELLWREHVCVRESLWCCSVHEGQGGKHSIFWQMFTACSQLSWGMSSDVGWKALWPLWPPAPLLLSPWTPRCRQKHSHHAPIHKQPSAHTLWVVGKYHWY